MATDSPESLDPLAVSVASAVGTAAGSSSGRGVGQVAGQTDLAPVKRIRNTKTQHRPGILRVKEYPVAEDRLENIGTLRTSAAFWLAIGSLAFGFALSCWQSLSLAGNDVTETAKATWTVYRNVSFIVAACAYVAGTYYFRKGNSVIKFIKDHTLHDPMN